MLPIQLSPHQMKNYQILLTKTLTSAIASLGAACILAFGSSAHAQTGPTIANVYPNGAYLLQPSPTLSFTLNSAPGVTSVSVSLVTTTLSGSLSYLQNLTPGSGLTVSGPNTSETVSATLKTNTLYTATISATDANGTTTATYSFDTISASYTWEARDWDYTSGLFVDNPQTNAYMNLPSTSGVDFNNPDYDNGAGGIPSDGLSSYRPQGLETEPCGDVPRLAYSPNTTNQDFDVGYNNGGNWGNYTRHYPAGNYNVYVRAADGNGNQTDAGDISVFAGTASFAVAGTNFFSVKSTGWQTYSYYPVLDPNNNLAVLTIPNDGTASTLRMTIDGGNCNENFFLLVPENTNVPPVTAFITNIYPNGALLFQPTTNELTFTADSTNGIAAGNILVQLTVTNLQGLGYTTNFTGSGLTVTGPSTSVNVSVPVQSNMIYTTFIQVIDGAGNPASANFTFNTINPAYTFEAEDFDFNNGEFYDNPQTNAYYGLTSDEFVDIDVATNNQNSFSYRGFPVPFPGYPNALNNEQNGDVPRAAYATTNINPNTLTRYIDYDVGFNSGGDWGDYTRTYPAGTYNVYMRGSNGGENGGGNVGAGFAQLSTVTSGAGTSTQTTSTNGTFVIYSTGNWQKYYFVPLKDQYGNLAAVTFSGGTETLRITTLGEPSGGSYNANFYMLMPAVVNLPEIENVYPDGAALFQTTNKLSFVATSGSTIATSNIVVTLNGVQATGLSFSPTTSGWIVNVPLQINSAYTAGISVKDNSSQVASTSIAFDTFQSTDYQFQAADYDYTNSTGTSGQFFDNPQVDAYYGTGGAGGVDELESDSAAFGRGYSYRLNNGSDFPDSLSFDLSRTNFTDVESNDYAIGSFGPGSWANYTRNYPAGTYNVWERYAEGQQNSHTTLSTLTSGYGTSTQTTSLLGTFTNLVGGWSEWTWAPLVNSTNGNLIQVTLNGSQTTLQLGGSAISSEPEVNVHFFILAPATGTPTTVKLKAVISGRTITISFPTQTGHSYQLQYENSLTGGSWTSLGSPVAGNGSTQSVNDTVGTGSRYYRVQIQ